jgi:HD-GYP domain-containing protein (c-di-GMP phosphodiesterase class II)
MSHETLYSSRIVAHYIRFFQHKFPAINLQDLLAVAGISATQVADRQHWFSRCQFEVFYQALQHASGISQLGKEAGSFAASEEMFRVSHHLIDSSTSPLSALKAIPKIAAGLTRGMRLKARQLAPNLIEISTVHDAHTAEAPYDCQFRLGLLEALTFLFNLDLAQVEHPDCLHHGRQQCRYLVRWQPSLGEKLQKLKARVVPLAVLLPGAAATMDPQWALFHILPLTVGSTLLLDLVASHLNKKRLVRSIDHLRSTSEALVEQINHNYNNALLLNEIAETTSNKTCLEDLLDSVTQTLNKRLAFDRGMILLVDPARKILLFRAGFGYDPTVKALLQSTTVLLDEAPEPDLLRQTFTSRRGILVADVDNPPPGLPPASLQFFLRTGTQSLLCCPITCDGRANGLLVVDSLRSGRRLTQGDLRLTEGLANVIGASLNNAQLLTSRSRQFDSMLQVLAATIDARDPMTSGHSTRVTAYSQGICQELGLSAEYTEMVRVAALLHDYGKIAVPDAILKKAGTLTPEEREIVRTHALHSEQILQEIGFDGIYRGVPALAGAHHEKMDGSGYPRGLHDGDIPIGAKIIAVADFFEAITAQRHYRGPMLPPIAYKALQEESLCRLDPRVVEAFLDYYQKAFPDQFRAMTLGGAQPERESVRIPCRTPVVCEINGNTLIGTSSDVSLRGIFVASQAQVRQGLELKLAFFLPDKPTHILETGGRVVWLNQSQKPRKISFPVGFGVEFTNLPRRALQHLAQFTQNCAPVTHH